MNPVQTPSMSLSSDVFSEDGDESAQPSTKRDMLKKKLKDSRESIEVLKLAMSGNEKDLMNIKFNEDVNLSKQMNISSMFPSVGPPVPISHCEIHEVPYNADTRNIPSPIPELAQGSPRNHRRSQSNYTTFDIKNST